MRHTICYLPRFLLLLHFAIVSTSICGQELLREQTIVIADNPIVSDSLPILYSSTIITASGAPIDSFSLSSNLTAITLSPKLLKTLKGQYVKVTYRVFPLQLTKRYQHLDSTIMKPFDDGIYIGGAVYNRDNGFSSDVSDLQYRGSFSRGFSVGNAQSLILNSNFNLQMAGDLGNDIKIAAAISDDNIPIQPQGNTQRLQEFDRVFIKVSKGSTEVTAGDYPLTRPKGYFTNYNKKLKGLSARHTSSFEGFQVTTDASVAASRGKFARQEVIVSEGNQGPYKLNGNNAERFLIVLSGTEKIYADGKLLARGFDYDYVIDYNRAEITFTPTFPVRRETRIIAEFEYTDQSYLRTLYAANTYLTSPKLDFNFNFYSEQDSKTATGDIVLDETDLETLRASGDDLDRAVRTGIFTTPDSLRLIGQVTYRLADNPTSTNPSDLILVYSDNPMDSLVTAAFTEVGAAAGSYIIDSDNVINGRVYKFVGPGLGNYEPILRLTPPEQRRLVSLGTTYRPTKHLTASGELSLSSIDINRLSSINDEDNDGLAGQLQVQHTLPIASKWKLQTKAHYEGLQSDYQALNPYRNAEFVRDWNVTNTKGREDLYNLSTAISRGDSLQLKYSYRDYSIGDSYLGTINGLTGKYYSPFGTSISGFANQLQSESTTEKTTFGRTLIDLKQLLHASSNTSLSLQYDAEQNEIFNMQLGQSISQQSRGYRLLTSTFDTSPLKQLSLQLQYRTRVDLFPSDVDLVKTLDIDEAHFRLDWKVSPAQQLKVTGGYRRLVVLDSIVAPDQQDKTTTIGRLDYTYNSKNGLVLYSNNYTINSGQQPKVEFYFEEVLPGQGDYSYLGNPDSTLINANFRYTPDLGTGNYIRLSLVNGEFITTTNQSFAQTLRVSPAKLFAKDKKLKTWQSILAKLSVLSNINLDKRSNALGSPQLFDFSQSDDDIVQYNGLISNTLFINRGKRSYDIQFNQKANTSIFTQVSGLEQRFEKRYGAKARIAAASSTDLILEAALGDRQYFSEIFNQRDFDISFAEVSPKVSFRPSDKFRVIFDYTYDTRQQVLTTQNQEDAISHQLGLDVTYRSTAIANITANIRYIDVTYNGVANSPLEFDILRGLKAGKNILWSTSVTRRLSNSVDISFSYEGRRNGDAPAVHIGRAQAKATF